jgi:uncharacterized membrane protein YfbV (UPF0208 family)
MRDADRRHGSRLLTGWIVAFMAVATALLGLVWLGARAFHPIIELLVVFGYVLLGSIAMVLTMAAGERIRADCSVVDDRHRD